MVVVKEYCQQHNVVKRINKRFQVEQVVKVEMVVVVVDIIIHQVH